VVEAKQRKKPKVLILASESCAYSGADNVGQIHAEYSTNTYIIRVPAPVIFPEEFYLRCFDKGIDAIIVMSCGHECPYSGAYDRLAKRISDVQTRMKEAGLNANRLRLCAICTVCSKAFLNEVRRMCELLGSGA
jgi:F420-non-reducing hydrogenase iron-sulfur subunit